MPKPQPEVSDVEDVFVEAGVDVEAVHLPAWIDR